MPDSLAEAEAEAEGEGEAEAEAEGEGDETVATACEGVGGDPFIEVFLGPGDLYFGDRTTRIRTLLGSCVAVTLWHPRARIGGMCHFVVPSRGGSGARPELSGHYADEALEILLREILAASTSPQDYQVKMFGGGSQFTALTMNVATRNVEAGLELLKRHRLGLTSMHFGGTGHRQVVLDVATGDVWVRHVARANL